MKEKWLAILKAVAVFAFMILLATAPVAYYSVKYTSGILGDFSSKLTLTASVDSNTFLYADNGELLYEIHGEINRTPIAVSDIPLVVVQAFVAVEDERFYRHRGIDIKAIIRAAVNYYKTNTISQGASTITQQVVRLYFLSPEQTMERKIKEAVLALDFERKFTKQEILELYLNRVYFGEGAYGIQSAAKVYFNKDATKLTAVEGALLAGMVQTPNNYNPYINPDDAQWRRNVVLEKMYEQGYLARWEKEDLLEAPIELERSASMGDYHSFFIDYVIDEAMEVVSSDTFFTGGLKIYTTYEPEVQAKVEYVCDLNQLYANDKMQVALAMVENETGAVKALVGGRQYIANRGFNRATHMTRQPGSAFKPMAVYVPAFERGYSPNSIVYDTPFKIGGYAPTNSGGGFYGAISIRTALQWSRNVPAVRLLHVIGVDEGFDMCVKLGFDLVEDDRCLPLALGGLTNGVTPLQMAGAYAAFANDGIYTKPYTIKRIEDSQGKIIYEHPDGVAVMSPQTAAATKDVLRSVVNGGTGSRANLRGATVSGKTGTTELPKTPEFRGMSGNKDAWFVGFTDEYTLAVWLGYDEKDMSRSTYLTSYGGQQPAEIFRLAMANVLGLDGGRPAPYTYQPRPAYDTEIASMPTPSDYASYKREQEEREAQQAAQNAAQAAPGDSPAGQGEPPRTSSAFTMTPGATEGSEPPAEEGAAPAETPAAADPGPSPPQETAPPTGGESNNGSTSSFTTGPGDGASNPPANQGGSTSSSFTTGSGNDEDEE